MALKDRKLDDYYTNIFGMCVSPGWKELQVDLQKLHDSLNEVSGIKDEQMLYRRQGALEFLKWLLNYETAQRAAYDALVEQDD